MSNYRGYGSRKRGIVPATPIDQPLSGRNQQKNNAGGYVFVLDPIEMLKRFLILGTAGGSYYASEQKMTRENLKNLFDLLKSDRWMEAIDLIAEISESGRAPKNAPALFALAYCVSCDIYGKHTHKVQKNKVYVLHRANHEELFERFPEEHVEKIVGRRKMVRRGDEIYATSIRTEKSPNQVAIDDPRDVEIRRYALKNLGRVVRTASHMETFVSYVEEFRGWGRALQSAVVDYFNGDSTKHVGLQALKYNQRAGFSQRDVLRLSHPKAPDETKNEMYRWIVKGGDPKTIGNEEEIAQIRAFEQLKKAQSEQEAISLISAYKLPRACIPGQWLNKPGVWEALLPDLALEEMVRNLGKMSAIGFLSQGSDASKLVASRLQNADAIRKARLHPLKVLTALKTYQSGSGIKLSWNPARLVVDALDSAFYLAFGAVTPSNKSILLALDVSGSMGSGEIAGMKGITPRIGTAAMSLVTASIEPEYEIMGFSHHFVHLDISPRQRLDDVIRKISGLPFEATDCSLPMVWAMQQNRKIDTFVIYTDNETWFDNRHGHPSEVLKKYRQETGIDAKLAVVGMTATKFSIADPNDFGMMDVVGFDTAAPEIISSFARGEL